MRPPLSMFTATDDLELALTTLASAALGLSRDVVRRPLSELATRLASPDGVTALRALALKHGVDLELPGPTELERLFEDELISSRALAAHRGRNIYLSGKIGLWKTLWEPFAASLAPSRSALELAERLVAWDTTPGDGAAIEDCVDWLIARLGQLGFRVETVRRPGHSPLLLARRPSTGPAGRIVLYGHYDACPAGEGWRTAPRSLSQVDGRLVGLGVGDNKAPLALRLDTLSPITESPEVLWILQGEEEIGSPVAHDLLPPLLANLEATIFLEENGYFDVSGTERLLAFRVDADGGRVAADGPLAELLGQLTRDASAWGISTRHEPRGLRKDFFPRGCPFGAGLPIGARYLALGINDDLSRIHAANESVPMWTWSLHNRQLRSVFAWVGEHASA